MATVKTLERKYVLSVCLGKHQIKSIQIVFPDFFLFFLILLLRCQILQMCVKKEGIGKHNLQYVLLKINFGSNVL